MFRFLKPAIFFLSTLFIRLKTNNNKKKNNAITSEIIRTQTL